MKTEVNTERFFTHEYDETMVKADNLKKTFGVITSIRPGVEDGAHIYILDVDIGIRSNSCTSKRIILNLPEDQKNLIYVLESWECHNSPNLLEASAFENHIIEVYLDPETNNAKCVIFDKDLSAASKCVVQRSKSE